MRAPSLSKQVYVIAETLVLDMPKSLDDLKELNPPRRRARVRRAPLPVALPVAGQAARPVKRCRRPRRKRSSRAMQ